MSYLPKIMVLVPVWEELEDISNVMVIVCILSNNCFIELINGCMNMSQSVSVPW